MKGDGPKAVDLQVVSSPDSRKLNKMQIDWHFWRMITYGGVPCRAMDEPRLSVPSKIGSGWANSVRAMAEYEQL